MVSGMHDKESQAKELSQAELHLKNAFPFIDTSGDIPDSITPERVRQIMMEALDRVVAEMFPGAMGERGFINPQHFATVVIETDTNERWRGVVYPEEPVR